MTYVYEEGQVAVPAARCTRCGGPLAKAEGTGSGTWTGWFVPSRISPSVWVFSSKPEPQDGERTEWVCPACKRLFALRGA